MASGQASAEDEISWALEGKSVRYHIQTDIISPLAITLRAKENIEFRTNRMQTFLDTRCEVEAPRGKKAWQLRCSLDQVAVRADILTGNAQNASRILTEWSSVLQGSSVQVVLTRDGQVRSTDLETGELRNRRENEIHSNMEMMLSRAFTGLDFQLPKNGTDEGAGGWKVRNANTMATPSVSGSLGAVRGEALIEHRQGDDLTIGVNARGVRQTGSTIIGLVGIVYAMTLTDRAVFSTADRMLVARRYAVHGTPTASTAASDGVRYVQQGVVDRLDESTVLVLADTAPQAIREWFGPEAVRPVLHVTDADGEEDGT